jgi:hypothetical protein
VTDKKVSVPTKQVPAKKAPVPAKKTTPVKVVVHGVKNTPTGPKADKKSIVLTKAESKVFHATKNMDTKGGIVATAALRSTNIPKAAQKAIVNTVVKQAKQAADNAVAQRNAAAETAKKIVKVVNKAAAIVEKKDGAKAAAPLKASAKKLEKVADKKLAAPKPVKAVQGIKPVPGKKNVPSKAFAKTIKIGTVKTLKAEQGFKDTKVANSLSVGVKPAVKPKQPNKDVAQSVTHVDAKTIIPSVLSAPAPTPVVEPIPTATELARRAAAARTTSTPREMSSEAAKSREELLRRTFSTLQASAPR